MAEVLTLLLMFKALTLTLIYRIPPSPFMLFYLLSVMPSTVMDIIVIRQIDLLV